MKIYTDVYQFLLKKTSSKEFDIILELVNEVDWGQIVTIDEYRLARQAGTTVRYVREVIKKLTSRFKGKRVLKKIDENRYIFLKGKSAILHANSDTYCKSYNFLYSKEFRSLSIYGKRILLNASMSFSLSGQGKAYLPLKDFIYRDGLSSGLIPSRRVLMEEIHKINVEFNGDMHVTVASDLNKNNRQEYIHVDVNEDILQNVKHNHVERELLRGMLFEAGYASYLQEEYCIEIEKVGKYIFNYLVKDCKDIFKQMKGDGTRYAMDVARKIYAMSIERVANKLHGLITEGENEGAISAYFSSVVFSVIVELQAKHRTIKSNIENVLSRFSEKIRELEYEKRLSTLDPKIKIFDNWITEWVSARIKEDEENRFKNEANIESNERLKEYIFTVFDNVEEKEKVYRGKIRSKRTWTSVFREWIESIIDLHRTRMSSIY